MIDSAYVAYKNTPKIKILLSKWAKNFILNTKLPNSLY
jgi:hypothetical protein